MTAGAQNGAYAGRRVGDRARRLTHLAGLILPLGGVIAAAALLQRGLVRWSDLAVLAVMYPAVGFGVVVGFHRLFSHHSFSASRSVELALAVVGSMAFQGSLIDWVADHRRHHAHADGEGDPHTPHTERGLTWRSMWHAHAGWLFRTHGRAEKRRYAPELLEDAALRTIDRLFPLWSLLSLAVPYLAGWGLSGEHAGGLTAMVWGGLVRVFVFNQVVFGVNSLGHSFGARRFATRDRSTNVAWLAVLSLGDSWHHNHHAFARSASLRLRWFEIDLAGGLIRLLELAGLARNVIRTSPERQRQRLAPPVGADS